MFNLLFFVVVFFPLLVCGQNQTLWKAYLHPIGLQIDNYHIEELGLGLYHFQNNRPINFEAGISMSKKVAGKLNFDTKFSIKKLNYGFQMTLLNPIDNITVFSIENRYMRKLVFSPNIGLSINTNLITLGIGIEPNLDLSYSTNVVPGYSPIYVFIDPINQKSGQLTIYEIDLFFNRIQLYLTPTLSFSYKLGERIDVQIEAKVKPYGNWIFYSMQIEGRTAEMPMELYDLNKIYVYNRHLFLYTGLSYRM